MTLFSRLLIVAAALPFVFATTQTSSKCKSTEFFWSDGDCCLTTGGSGKPSPPPTGKQCPSIWEWDSSKSHCVPQHPPPTGNPSCSSGYGWNSGSKCCEHTSTSSKPTPSAPPKSVPTPPSKSTPAAPSKPTSSPPSQCKSTEFYWGDGECCLPSGGSPKPPSPPKGTSCPHTWQWHTGKTCCVPTSPPTGTPSCPTGGWNKDKKCCEENPTTSAKPPTSTKPSGPTGTKPPASTPTGSCGSNEFYWSDKECCLPHGGPTPPPQPPSGTSCPSNWSWHTGKKCCAPHHPNPPPPQCGSGWGWDTGSKCCFPGHTSTSTHPAPSSKPGGHKNYKRHGKARAVSLCPQGLEACPIRGISGLTDDWECADTRSDLESCGGCSSTGAGQDCTAISGAWNVGCNNGKCVVYTCATGYLRSLDNKSCMRV